MVDRPLTSRENWFLSLVNLPLWRIVFINTRWRDWSRRTPAPLLTKIRMENEHRAQADKLHVLEINSVVRFLGNRLACHQEKETWIDCLCHMKTFIEWKREEADDSSYFVVGFSLYPVTIALQVFVVEMFFMNLLLILRCQWWTLKTTSKHWKLDITGFLNQFIFFFFEREKKNLRGKNDLLMFKIETYSISIVNKID